MKKFCAWTLISLTAACSDNSLPAETSDEKLGSEAAPGTDDRAETSAGGTGSDDEAKGPGGAEAIENGGSVATGGSTASGGEDGEDEDLDNKPPATIFSLAELRAAVQLSDQNIVLEAGNYNITELPEGSRFFPVTGSNNEIDLVGVYIDFPVDSTDEEHFGISGSGNTLRGGTFENTYASGLTEVTDFSAYNNDRRNLANGAGPHLVITGADNLIVGTKMTVRGSFPYGYGSIYGIGRDNTFGLDKRAGIAVQGPRNTIDDCELQVQAFGHGIYIQNPADETVVRNTLVEGVVRPSADLYEETNSYDLPFISGYVETNGVDDTDPVPLDVMYSLPEDGIRVYSGGGSVTVENCTVKKMRGGIRLYLASAATVSNSTAIDCGATNFNMPRGGTVTNSSGNFSYSPLSDFRLSKSDQDLELTILPSPDATGPHNLADILGNNHTLVFHRSPGPLDDDETRAIVVSGNNSEIRNETEYAIVLEAGTSGNTVESAGPVTDNGTNSVTSIPLSL